MAIQTVDRLLGWVGIAGVDAVVRLVLQVLTTVVLARAVTPSDFGVSALVLSSVVILVIVVGGVPFEESLTQRRVVRRRHLESALAVSWAGGAVATLLAWPVGGWLGGLFDVPDFPLLLTVCCLLLFSEAYLKILTAVARRRRRFSRIAAAQSIGAAVGSAVAIALAIAGGGVWAVVSFRLATSAATAATLSGLLRVVPLPRYRAHSLSGMGRFSGTILLDNLIDNLAFLVFNYAIGTLFGTAALGFVNMALRVVEPLRGAVVAVTHNLSFPFFRDRQNDPAALRPVLLTAVRTATVTTVPTFLGLAAVAPALIPVLAGPDWAPSIRLTELLCLGAALFLPLQMALTAMTATGRPHVALLSGLSGMTALGTILWLTAPLGILAAGLARLTADAAEAAVSLFLTLSAFKIAPSDLVRAVGVPWLLALAMAVLVRLTLTPLESALPTAAALCIAVVIGAAIYPALLAVVQPHLLAGILAWYRQRKAG